MIETIEENTMGTLDEVATGMASMGIGRYALPNGSMVQGMSCVLAPVEQEKRDHRDRECGGGAGCPMGSGQDKKIPGRTWLRHAAALG
jgi:hypothetical protein